MKNMLTRRHGLAVLASALALSFSLPAVVFAGASAGDSFQSVPKPPAPKRPASDKITMTCLPGHADYDPDKCHEDITK